MSIVKRLRTAIAALRKLAPTGPLGRGLQRLIALVEDLLTEHQRLRDELQETRDELNRLKGEQGKPTVRPGRRPRETSDRSSSRDLDPPARQRPRRRAVPPAPTQRVEERTVDRATVPPDVQKAGHRVVRVRHLRIVAEDILFRCERVYSPSTGRTYQAPLPPGYAGGFSPQTRALAVYLSFRGLMSEAAILDFYRTHGLPLSAGTLATWLSDDTALSAEYDAIFAAALASEPHEHIDATSTRVNGEPQACTALVGPHFSYYRTQPEGDRLAVLTVLQGLSSRTDLPMAVTDVAEAFLDRRAGKVLSQGHRAAFRDLPRDHLLTLAAFETALDTALPDLRDARVRRLLTQAAAIGGYHLQTRVPVVTHLVADAAPEYTDLTAGLTGCWVHERRHYKRLVPATDEHRTLVDRTLRRFTAYYHALQAYREQPNPDWAGRLRRGFHVLFGQATKYQALDTCLRQTLGREAVLLYVLDHPTVPLHNNPAELAIRRRVRKRDVSFGPRTTAGAHLWDHAQTVLDTATKLGVNTLAYLVDRLSGQPALPSLADLIRARARASPAAPAATTIDRSARPASLPAAA